VSTESLLPRKEVVTRDDLEEALREIGVRRVKVVEIKAFGGLIVSVRPKHRESVFKLLDERLALNLGVVVATLSFWECLIRRRQYVIL
jgi:hypothetical protein